MATTEKANMLHSHLASMIALEKAIVQKLGDLLLKVTPHAEVSALFSKFQLMASDQRQILEARLQDIGGNIAISNEVLSSEPTSESNLGENHPVSTALQAAYTLFNQAIIGYAVLHPLATRFADSLVIADPEAGEVPPAIADSGARVIDVPLQSLAADIPGGRPNMIALGAAAG